jgi:regulator of protease activity HflC (stomatin/prohibitin superfamily)
MFYQKFPEGEARTIALLAERLIIPVFALIILLNTVFIVSPGERSVVVRLGSINRIAEDGLHFKIPLLEKNLIFDVKTVKLERNAQAYSKDIQTVSTHLALNFHIYPDKVGTLYQEVGRDFVVRIIDPAIQEALKASAAQFSAQQLIEERHKVTEEIKTKLITRLEKYFSIDEFSIIDFSFSDEYEKAVEAKQVAQQSALKAENDLIRIKTEAEQRVAEARAEAEAIKIQAQAITQQGGKDYVQLKAIEKWNGQVPSHMIPGAAVPFIDLK